MKSNTNSLLNIIGIAVLIYYICHYLFDKNNNDSEVTVSKRMPLPILQILNTIEFGQPSSKLPLGFTKIVKTADYIKSEKYFAENDGIAPKECYRSTSPKIIGLQFQVELVTLCFDPEDRLNGIAVKMKYDKPTYDELYLLIGKETKVNGYKEHELNAATYWKRPMTSVPSKFSTVSLSLLPAMIFYTESVELDPDRSAKREKKNAQRKQ